MEGLAAAGHGEDVVHPRAHPLELLGGADRPHERDAPRGGRAGGVGGQEGAHVAELVGDARAAGEEEDGAVGVEGVRGAVWPFDEAGEVEGPRGGRGCEAVEGGGHPGALGDNEGEGVARPGREGEVGGRGGEFFVGGMAAARGGPGDGEGMRHPQRDSWEVDVRVHAGVVGPRAR